LSTGPRTTEGRVRCARARRSHGYYSAEMIALRRAGAALCRRMDALTDAISIRRTAGHGVLPPNLANGSGGKPQMSPPNAPPAARPPPFGSLRPRLRSPAPPAFPAGPGPLPPFPAPPPPPRPPRLLAGTPLCPPFSAGHGVLPPFSPAGPVPAGMVGQPARQF